MPNKYTGRTPKQVERKPDSRGMISVNLTLRMPEPLYKFMMQRCEDDKRSLSTMAVLRFEEYKEKYERLLK